MDTRLFWILGFSLVLLGSVFAADEAGIDHFEEGKRLFGEQNFAGALDEFQKADAIVPNDATINSWLGASLSALGMHAEAKQRLEAAFKLLEDQRNSTPKGQTPTPIALGYYSLLAEIQVKLHEFEGAVRTIQSYKIPESPEIDAVAENKAFGDAKKAPGRARRSPRRTPARSRR